MTHQTITRSIIQEIQTISHNYKQKYPIFKHQDAIGFSIWTVSLSMIGLAAYGYLYWQFNMWLVMLWIAFWTSILHELEHDLIHYLYFKKQPLLHHLMMAGVWIFRPMTVSPWFRRHLHLHHHKYSGMESDLEERAVTNGLKWGLFRAIFMPDQILGVVLRMPKLYFNIRKMEKEGKFTKVEIRNLYNIVFFGFLPIGLPLYFAWYAYLAIYLLLGIQNVFSLDLHLPAICGEFLDIAQPFMVLLVIPNVFRQYCLHFITSNLHYYGDIEKGNFLQQTQVLDAWWTFPFQLFCFNFGHTHAIHHFFVQETFYLRQLTSRQALAVLKKNGVRFNDLGTFERANRYHEVTT